MSDKDKLKQSIKAEVDSLLPRLVEVSDWIGRHPELGSEEYESSKLLADELEKHGFKIERDLLGMETAFLATYRGRAPGPRVAFLAEYDALPGVGHGCGHNIIGTAAVGAGISLSRLLRDLPGEVLVFGTPAEEGHGPSASAKKRMVDEGLFNDVDVVMMIHPTSGRSMVSTSSLAIGSVTIVFKGKTSHAAASPELGINALNAAMITYMAVHANRQQFRRDANAVIHGILTEGGLASNVIPDRAVLQYGVRSSDDSYVPELIKMVENCARGAAIATGCEVEIVSRPGLKSKVRNETLEKLFARVFQELGVDAEDLAVSLARPPQASTDFADVTHVVPGITAMIAITPKRVAGHSRELAEATLSEDGHRGLEIGTKMLAVAGIEVLTDPQLLQEIKRAQKKEEKT